MELLRSPAAELHSRECSCCWKNKSCSNLIREQATNWGLCDWARGFLPPELKRRLLGAKGSCFQFPFYYVVMGHFQPRKGKKKSQKNLQPVPGVNPVPAGNGICFPCCSWRMIELDISILGKEGKISSRRVGDALKREGNALFWGSQDRAN